MLRTFCKKALVCVLSNVLITATFVSTTEAYMRPLPPDDFGSMYRMAARGDVVSLHEAVSRGLNIDAVNADGDTGVCVAVKRRDAKAYNTFRAAGASGTPPCRWEIAHWESFINSAPVQAGVNWRSTDYTMPVYTSSAEKSNMWAWIGGAALIGGGAALALSGGGGGGGDDSSDNGDDNPTPATCDTTAFPISGGCPGNGTCSACSDSSGIHYKLTACNSGYSMSADGLSCLQDQVQTCDTTAYPITGGCPDNGVCEECADLAGTHYKLNSCNDGYTMATDGKSCAQIQLEPCDTAVYTMTSCPDNASCADCTDSNGKYYKFNGCNDGYFVGTDGKSCQKAPEGATCDTSVYKLTVCPTGATCSPCTDTTGTYYQFTGCLGGYTRKTGEEVCLKAEDSGDSDVANNKVLAVDESNKVTDSDGKIIGFANADNPTSRLFNAKSEDASITIDAVSNKDTFKDHVLAGLGTPGTSNAQVVNAYNGKTGDIVINSYYGLYDIYGILGKGNLYNSLNGIGNIVITSQGEQLNSDTQISGMASGSDSYLYNAFGGNGKITINAEAGNINGMKGVNLINAYNGGNAEINLTAKKGFVRGMALGSGNGGLAANAYSDNGSETTGTITINNSDNNEAIGIGGGKSSSGADLVYNDMLIYNAYGKNSTGKIIINGFGVGIAADYKNNRVYNGANGGYGYIEINADSGFSDPYTGDIGGIFLYDDSSYGYNGSSGGTGEIKISLGGYGSNTVYGVYGAVDNGSPDGGKGIIDIDVANYDAVGVYGGGNYKDASIKVVSKTNYGTVKGISNVRPGQDDDSAEMKETFASSYINHNNGTVTVEANELAATGYGIYSKGVDAVNDVLGKISVSSSKAYGIYNDGNIYNKGTITVSGSVARGLWLADKGTVINEGVIEVIGNGVYSSGYGGLSEAGEYGIYTPNGDSTVSIVNKGTIKLTNTNGGTAIKAQKQIGDFIYNVSDSFANIDNQGDIIITGKNNNGIYVYNSSGEGSLKNSGTISISGTVDKSSFGLAYGGGDSTVFANSGDIKMDLSDNIGTAIGLSFNSTQNFNNSGNIEIKSDTVSELKDSTGGKATGIYVRLSNSMKENINTGNVTMSGTSQKRGIWVEDMSLVNKGNIKSTSSGDESNYGLYVSNAEVHQYGDIDMIGGTRAYAVVSNGGKFYIMDGANVNGNVWLFTKAGESVGYNSGVINGNIFLLQDLYGFPSMFNYNKIIGNVSGSGYFTNAKSGYVKGDMSNVRSFSNNGVWEGETGTFYNIYNKGEINLSKQNAKQAVLSVMDVFNNEGTVNLKNVYINLGRNGTLTTNSGAMELTSTSDDLMVAWAAFGGFINSGRISAIAGNADAYGILSYGESEKWAENQEGGNIIVSTKGGDAYGMYGKDASLSNNGTITVSSESGTAYGIYAEGGSVENSGTINVKGTEGKIYGIYATGGATVTNTGTIILNGAACEGDCNGNYIVLDGTSTLSNASLIVAQGLLDFDAMGGQVMLAEGGQFAADELSGRLLVSSEITAKGFENEYTAVGAIDSADVSGLNLQSQSALFDAKLAENGSDVTLTMKSFDEVVGNKSLAAFLAQNYHAQNGESLFNNLKSAETAAALNKNLNNFAGQNLFSRMAFEDFTMLRELNHDMNEQMFSGAKNEYFSISGNTAPFAFDSSNGSNSKWSLTGKKSGETTYALGFAFTDVYSNDADNQNRRADRMFNISAPVGYKLGGLNVVSTPRFGYAYGTYNRKGFNNRDYKGTISKQMFGFMNEARLPIKTAGWTLAPSVELNLVNYRTEGEESANLPYALRVKEQNNYSLEAGLGLHAGKQVNFDEQSALSFNLSAAVYHEFGNPYETKVMVNGLSGSFAVRDEERGANRAALRSDFEFRRGNAVLSGSLMSYFDRSLNSKASINLKYGF